MTIIIIESFEVIQIYEQKIQVVILPESANCLVSQIVFKVSTIVEASKSVPG